MKKTTLAALAFLSSCAPAYAQQLQMIPSQLQCGESEFIMGRLSEQFNETVQFRGVTTSGMLDLFYLNEETGSYTMLRVAPNGIACIKASGVSGEFMTYKRKPNL